MQKVESPYRPTGTKTSHSAAAPPQEAEPSDTEEAVEGERHAEDASDAAVRRALVKVTTMRQQAELALSLWTTRKREAGRAADELTARQDTGEDDEEVQGVSALILHLQILNVKASNAEARHTFTRRKLADDEAELEAAAAARAHAQGEGGTEIATAPPVRRTSLRIAALKEPRPTEAPSPPKATGGANVEPTATRPNIPKTGGAAIATEE